MNRQPIIHAIDQDGEKGSFAADVKILKSRARQRMVWMPAATKPRQMALTVARPGWTSFSVSLLLHAAFVGALVLWAPMRIEHIAEAYVVEIVTAPPSLAFSDQRPAASPKKEVPPPPQPPEPPKEIPPTKPEPVVVAAPTPPQLISPPHPPTPAPTVPVPLRIAAVAATAAPRPVTATVSRAAVSNAITTAATSGGNAEDVADPAYVNSIREAVAHQLRYPELALRRGIEGRVVLRLTLTASGHLLKAAPGEPAADAALTNAALTAVRRAAPFRPWHGTRNPNALLSLILPIRFILDEKGEKL